MKEIPVRKIWQWKILEYISYLLVFILPLLFSQNHLHAFFGLKYIYLIALVFIVVILYFWGNFRINDFKLNISCSHIFLLLFFIILTLSSIFGVDPINSFFNWNYGTGLIFLYTLGLFSLIVGFLINKNKKFLLGLLLSSFLSSLIVTIIFYTGLAMSIMPNTVSTIGNDSYLGEYLFFNILFGCGLFLYYKEYWKKILLFWGILFIFISPIFVNKDILVGKISLLEAIKHPFLFLGMANGATMGFLISLLVIVFLFLISSRKKLLKIVGSILLVSFILGVIYTGNQLVKPDSTINKIFVEEKSGNRFLSWDIAKQGFSENPVLGVGLNNFPYVFRKNFNPDFYKDEFYLERFNQPHNIFWEFASSTGALGLLSFLALLIVTFISLFNIKEEDSNRLGLNKIRIILAGVLFGYFIQNLFVFDTVSTYLMLFLIIGIGIGFNQLSWSVNFNKRLHFIKKIFLIVGILLSIMMIYLFAILPFKESREAVKILKSANTVLEFKNSSTNFSNISLLGGIVDSTYLAEHISKKIYDNLSEIDNINKDKYLVIIKYISNLVENDLERQPYYMSAHSVIGSLMNLYMIIDSKDGNTLKIDGNNYNSDIWNKADRSFTKAIELSPNYTKNYFLLAKTYLIKKEIDKAKEMVKRGILIDPENIEGYKLGRLLLVVPDKDFQKYLDDMEQRWVINK